MPRRICILLFTFTFVAASALPAGAPLLPQVTPQPAKAPATKPAQIVVETSPNAEVYLDDQYTGRASPAGRLVIGNPKPGKHNLRVSLAGKRDFQGKITVVAGRDVKIVATLAKLPAAGSVRVNRKDGLKYVWVPPGTFMMGCSPGDGECFDDEKPSHQVTISKGFWMGQTEVTVAAYRRFAAATGRPMPPEPDWMGRLLNPGWGGEAMPIVDVTWEDAQAYCGWAGGRLPTEAEWEYAARAGSTSARYGDLDEIAWYADNSGRQRLDTTTIFKEDRDNYTDRLNENGIGMHEVGKKRANEFGLFDMLGNEWEWVNDWYDEKYYQTSPSPDPAGPASGTARLLRGGCWFNLPRNVRVSMRRWGYPGVKDTADTLRCGGDVFAP
jgi:formylglycine-generating enzyme required for sulfatase activity